MTDYIITEEGFAQLEEHFIVFHKEDLYRIAWKNFKDKHTSPYNPQAEREKVLDKLEQLLCAHHKYIGSYRVITGTNEEIYDEMFDAMQEFRKDGE